MKYLLSQYLETARIDKTPMKSDDFIMIRKIAEEARDTIQKYLIKNAEEAKDNTPGWIDKEDMSGACAIASFFIQKKLKQSGYESRVQCIESKSGGAHCFVIVRGNTHRHIIDVTATQFTRKGNENKRFIFPKIVIRKDDTKKSKYDNYHKQGYGVPINTKLSDVDWINKNWVKFQTPGYHKELFK